MNGVQEYPAYADDAYWSRQGATTVPPEHYAWSREVPLETIPGMEPYWNHPTVLAPLLEDREEPWGVGLLTRIGARVNLFLTRLTAGY